MVWATGWEDKANFYLPNMLGLPELPHLTFDGAARFGSAHWKLGPLDEYGQRPGDGLDRRQLRRELLRVGPGARRADPAGPDRVRTSDSRRPKPRRLIAWAAGIEPLSATTVTLT